MIRRTRNKEGSGEENVDLLPMMGLFCILLPFLLACASFAAVKVIDINLPEVQTVVQKQEQKKDKVDEGLLLCIFITDEGLVLGAQNAILPTTFTKEVHKYVYHYPVGTANKETFLYPITKKTKTVLPPCPKDPSRQLTLFEREEIILYAVQKDNPADTGKLIDALYDEFGQVMTLGTGSIANAVPDTGDTLYTLSYDNRRMIIVDNPKRFTVRNLTVYDELASRLLRIRSRYPNVPDQGEIRIAAEDDVVFDKLVHVMDVCRLYGYPKISLAKLAN